MKLKPIKFANYQAIEIIYESSRTLVYRGQQIDNHRPVVIKLMRNPYPTFRELVQFRNQYTITKNLEIQGIVQSYALERYENRYALIMEDIGGISLADYRETLRSLSLLEFLKLAIQIAEILHELHKHCIIHKDIKPANIIIQQSTQQIKLIDFSISTLLPKETQTIQTPNVLEGTLAYLSPEQTGRMNRGIDYRSDFYSLGVTFYELLMGGLPFTSEDSLDLIHNHIACPPYPLTNSVTLGGQLCPEPLSDIVMKLMAKNAEDRYQSAWGLKYDLEQCLWTYKETGKIQPFVLGERDICSRFLIPEKLYGREAEVTALLQAFKRVSQGDRERGRRGDRETGRRGDGETGRWGDGEQTLNPNSEFRTPNAELVLVAGYSGVGKTAVINEVHKPIVRQKGYFIKGKFDQFNRNIPFSAFVQAFRDLIGQILSESDLKLEQWKGKILQALGENGQVLIEVIPELETVIGKQPAVPALSGSAAQNRFNLLFSKFIQVFTTDEHPLVIFLDDLQWSDSASLNLLKLLMDELEMGYLLVLGAYRDNEVYPAHPLMLALNEIKKQGATLKTLMLAPLDGKDINRLVADTLRCSTDVAMPLSQLVYQKAQGNPFFTTQFLKGLHSDGWIAAPRGYWQCDLAKVQQLALTDDVVEFMVGRLQKLPEETQDVLKLAACIGNQFDLATLAVACEKTQEQVAADLWGGLQKGFVIPQTETYKFFQGEACEERVVEAVSVRYRFLHDRVQQAAYALISEARKQATHLTIGRQLWQNLSKRDRFERLFAIVNHFNLGRDLIVEKSERDRVARLNLQASQKAKASAAYEASLRYCYAGQHFLAPESWQDNYSLCFEFAIATTEAEFLNHNLPVAQQLAQEALEKAKTLGDRIKIHELQILFEIGQNKMKAAISLTIDTLELLDISLPKNSQEIQAEVESLRQEVTLPTEGVLELANLQEVKDEEKLAVIRILITANSAAYIAKPELHPLIVLHTVRCCMKLGNSDLSATAYSWYGAFLCAVYGEIDAGYEFGKLALQLLDKFDARALTAKVNVLFNAFIRPWKEPIQNSLAAFPEAIQGGLDNGDIEYAFYNAVHYCNYLFYSGASLEEVYRAQKTYLPLIIKANYDFHEGFLRINQQVVANLRGETDSPQFLQGSNLDGETYLAKWLDNNIVFLVLCFYEAQTRLAYLFENYTEALAAGEKGWQYRQAAIGTLYVSEHNFYHSLALLASEEFTPQKRDRVASNQRQLKIWAKFAPTNFQHKYDLVEAEKCRVLGKKLEAIELYDRAICGAEENGYLQEEALANERAALFYLNWGKKKVASSYLQEAYYCYARWGAKAKVVHLSENYPQLLGNILQSDSRATILETTNKVTEKQSIVQSDIQLDFPTVLKAAQAISQEIELEKLLATLMQTIVANAGAQRGHLILRQDEQWVVVARADRERTQVLEVPLERYLNLPTCIIYSVARTQEIIVFENLSQEVKFASDRYIAAEQPQSVLCMPIARQGKLLGVLYLENNLTVGAFTRDRVEILQLLSSQAAISLENACLYQKTENYAQILETEVERKTQALNRKARNLEQTLKQLQQAQAQLIQSEKMSSLGQLVAGIAHEINNPISFIKGNILPTKCYIEDLMDLLELYQQEYPNPKETIKEKKEEIDFDFIFEDATKMLDSMEYGSDRIEQVVLSLRDFSRLDESEIKKVDVCSGIESTLLILQHRFQKSVHQPKVKIIKEYGQLPKITCCPSQLNQVFLNIINNALDAIQENPQNDTKPHIRICTEPLKDDRIRIAISNNGSPIPETIQDRIFDPFFTTKPVGRGTGLGLFVSYSIIQQHGGTIAARSRSREGTEFEIILPQQCL